MRQSGERRTAGLQFDKSDNPGAVIGESAVGRGVGSAIRVCQPGPAACQRANVSGGNRIEIDVRALPGFGRQRGFSILAADYAIGCTMWTG
jgi:hypothetical protein